MFRRSHPSDGLSVMKPNQIFLLKVIVSAACLAALFAWMDPAALIARLRRVSLAPLAAAALVNLILQGLNAAKLRLLLPPPASRPASPHGFFALARVNFIAAFFTAFLPGGIGGEVARWTYLRRVSGTPESALAGVLLDRLTGLWAQILLGLLAWIWLGRSGPALWTAVPMAALVLAASLWVGAFGYRWFARLAAKGIAWYARRAGSEHIPTDIGAALADLVSQRGRLARVAALSLVNHGFVILAFLLVDLSAGGSADWAQAVLYVFFFTLFTLLPVAVGNWGLSEGTLGILYHVSGAHGETGVLISLLLRAMSLPTVCVGWWFFLAGRGKPGSR